MRKTTPQSASLPAPLDLKGSLLGAAAPHRGAAFKISLLSIDTRFAYFYCLRCGYMLCLYKSLMDVSLSPPLCGVALFKRLPCARGASGVSRLRGCPSMLAT